MNKYEYFGVNSNVVIEIIKEVENDNGLSSANDNKVRPKIGTVISKGDDVPDGIKIGKDYLISGFSGYQIPDLNRELYVIDYHLLMVRRELTMIKTIGQNLFEGDEE